MKINFEIFGENKAFFDGIVVIFWPMCEAIFLIKKTVDQKIIAIQLIFVSIWFEVHQIGSDWTNTAVT
jgi:hypothetical protein